MTWQISTHPCGIKEIQLTPHTDERGLFCETNRADFFQAAIGDGLSCVQSNLSISHRHVLRGLHFQRQHPQGKLIHLLQGLIIDVAVDIRLESPFFGYAHQITLDADKHCQLWIPPGFAHGFLVLSETAQLMYHCTDYYHPQDQGCLKWNDSALNIDWHIDKPILSEQDKQGKSLLTLFGQTPKPTKNSTNPLHKE